MHKTRNNSILTGPLTLSGSSILTGVLTLIGVSALTGTLLLFHSSTTLAEDLTFDEIPLAHSDDTAEVWAEHTKYRLDPDTDYSIDLDGDGTEELFSFTSVEDYNEENYESHGVLSLYIDHTLVQELTEENYSYSWTVSQVPLSDGRTLLSAWSNEDNDWTDDAPVLEYKEGAFRTLADLTEMTRGDEKLISGWGRLSYIDVSENNMTAYWYDNPYSIGNNALPVVYAIDGETVAAPSDLITLSQNRWTVQVPFDVFTEPDAAEVLFTTAVDEQVAIDQLQLLDGKRWLHLFTADGTEGWFPDPDEYVFVNEGIGGYFKESFFAG